MIGRVIIEDVRPSAPDREHPAKAIAGHSLAIRADVYKEGHDELAAWVWWRPSSDGEFRREPMSHLGNDRWEASIVPAEVGMHSFMIVAGTDRYATWRHHAVVKQQSGQDIEVELQEACILLSARLENLDVPQRALFESSIRLAGDTSLDQGARLAAVIDPGVSQVFQDTPVFDDETRSAEMLVWVDRPLAGVGAWYELFPRSEGGFEGASKRLEEIARMGFDIVYLPPIHPIGKRGRKGRNNTLDANPDDPGSPWAIGSEEGGHTEIEPSLGNLEDLKRFIAKARALDMEVALDYALQCSPDHPWVAAHPEWFHQRPDGSVKYAENPPKKYQDIYPINFWPAKEEARAELWDACREILKYWMSHGIRVFRVDNPHTKPVAFWEWLIASIHRTDPDIIFLAEAFTRPKMMAKLAEVGFSQSYTYFTWRTEKKEITDYLMEVSRGRASDYMRPNFWPNTPDILSGPLRGGGPTVFKQRLVLAAAGSPAYGIYSGYELFENEPASPDNEEYLDSEKYEIKRRDWGRADSLVGYISKVNEIRRAHPAFHQLRSLCIHGTGPDVVAFSRCEGDDLVLVVVSLTEDPPVQAGLRLDLDAIGLAKGKLIDVREEITGAVDVWDDARPSVTLTREHPAAIFELRQR